MKYSDSVPIEDLKIMAKSKGMLKNYRCDKFFNQKAPNFLETYKEMLWLKKNVKADKCFVNTYDDMPSVFLNCLNWDDNAQRLIKQLIKDTSKVILKLKWHYNRLRPYQIAEKTNVKLDNIRLASMESPSYPSGHSTQAVMLATYLSHKYPEHKNKLFEVAKHISNSRLIAKCHYPSDIKFGEVVGNDIANYLIDLNIGYENEQLPFDQEMGDGYVIRTFNSNVNENKLKWHTDGEDRWVEPINNNDWKIQFDNELPQPIDKRIFIPEGVYHRVIKGNTKLELKIIKQ